MTQVKKLENMIFLWGLNTKKIQQGTRAHRIANMASKRLFSEFLSGSLWSMNLTAMKKQKLLQLQTNQMHTNVFFSSCVISKCLD